MISPIKRAVNIRVRGIVQGVGFRPFIFKLAQSYDLNGWVLNDESGVKIHIEGFPDRVSEFIAQLPLKSPQAARIENIEIEEDANCDDYSKFEIVLSSTGEQTSTRISPDLLVCNDCIADLENSDGRYFNYPYVNCTNCGPRFSIIKSLPYDRQATTMSEWKMCAQCITEYENVNDRRFHAQPVACPKCGPNYYLRENDETSFGIDAIKKCVQLLNEGKIVAIKGIGGYHLCCGCNETKKSIQKLA